MCLLKRDEYDTNCGHEECKSYYMLNKQICMYNLTSLPLNLTAGRLTQNQLASKTQHVLSTETKSSLSLPKQRHVMESVPESHNEPEPGQSQKKKIKLEGT